MNIINNTSEPLAKNKTFKDYANDFLNQFPGVDRTDLLNTIVALALMDRRYGNKREERAACDLLNLVQAEAIKQLAKAGMIPPSPELDKAISLL